MAGSLLLCLLGLLGYALARGRHDVVLSVIGYLLAALGILAALACVAAYLYVLALADLWQWAMS